MKEDILEQLIDDYLQTEGYFTRHNIHFKPRSSDDGFAGAAHAVSSDIDVVGIHPRKRGKSKVWVVSCKSWQSGFNAQYRLEQMKGVKPNPKREIWRGHRELWDKTWAASFRREVHRLTGQSTFRYSIAVARLTGRVKDPKLASELWASNPKIKANLSGSTFDFLEFGEVWTQVRAGVDDDGGNSPAASEIGRLAQLLRAARID